MNLEHTTGVFVLRLVPALIAIVLELLMLSVLVDARTLQQYSTLSILLAESGNIVRWVVVSVGIFALLIASDLRSRVAPLARPLSWQSWGAALLSHVVMFLGLTAVTVQVFGAKQSANTTLELLWLILVLLTGVSWCLVVASAKSWREFLSKEYRTVVLAGICGIVVVSAGFYFQQYWTLMTEFTLGATSHVLGLFYDDILYDFTLNKVGLEEFWVFVDASCSGIEGMVLAAATTAIYLFLSRRYLKFPHALLLIPLACVISVALNILRISVLIIIGAEWSPALAVGGFHSVAGWIAAVLVALLIVFFFSSWSWIQRDAKDRPNLNQDSADGNLAEAILVPFVIFLGVTLVAQIFADGFDFIYPVKVIAASAALLYYWKQYRMTLPIRLIESIVAGVLVALVWVLLVPSDTTQDTAIAGALSEMGFAVLLAWSLFRLAGFLILAPILEELVFRSYLLGRLSGQEVTTSRKPEFKILGFVGSALLFGFIHSAPLAGIGAGLIFAVVRYRAGTISSCVVAHAVANLAVFGWAAYTGQWSLV